MKGTSDLYAVGPNMNETGQHLLIDGRTERSLTGTDLTGYITAVIEAIEMTLIFGPVLVAVGRGIQAHAIIAESHIMVKAMIDGRV